MEAVFANAWVYKLIPRMEPSRKAEENLKRIKYAGFIGKGVSRYIFKAIDYRPILV